MNTSQASAKTKIKVGLFTLGGLALLAASTVYVNDRPSWWKDCQFVKISIDDATGLRMKSPVRSLGLQIGYLKTVDLTESHVSLGICITEDIEVLPSTRAYIRGEGFLGDKFVELKPVRYVGGAVPAPAVSEVPAPVHKPSPSKAQINDQINLVIRILDGLVPSASAQTLPAQQGREIPVGQRSQDVEQLVKQVDGLVDEMTSLTNNLKETLNPQELKATMNRINQTLENASRTLSPEGGLNTTAQRTLAKLEDAIEQLRDMMTRVNRGEGSVGMLLNDPSYALELRSAIKNINGLLGKVQQIRFHINVGAVSVPAYDNGRGWFQLSIWPDPDRYYLIGVTVDPRGRLSTTTTKTTSAGVSTVTDTQVIGRGEILITAMLGKVLYNRIDLSIGALYGDGAFSTAFHLGPSERETMFTVRNDLFSRGQQQGIDDRISLIAKPFYGNPLLGSIYLQGGLDSVKKTNGLVAYSFGGGVSFDDDDIKLLFSLR